MKNFWEDLKLFVVFLITGFCMIASARLPGIFKYGWKGWFTAGLYLLLGGVMFLYIVFWEGDGETIF